MTHKLLKRHEFCEQCYWFDIKSKDFCGIWDWDISPAIMCMYFQKDCIVEKGR